MTKQEPKKSNLGTLMLLALAAIGAGALLFMLRPSEVPKGRAETRKEEAAKIAAEAPKPADEAPQEVIKPQTDPNVMRDALLGDKKDKPAEKIAEKETIAEREKPAEKAPARVKKRKPIVDERDEPADNMLRSGGGLSDAAFYSAVESWRGVKSCLASGTARKDETQANDGKKGALRISFRISNSGEVLDSKVFEPSNEIAKAIAPCVERSARQIKFPTFESDSREATKVAKFVF